MRTAVQTESTKRAILYLQQKGIKSDINWDNPTPDCFKIFNVLLDAGLLVDRNGWQCSVINRYGPNPHGLVDTSAINQKYGK